MPHKKIGKLIAEVRKVLPVFRGGTGLPGAPSSPFGRPEAGQPPKPTPLPKTFQFTPTVPSDPYPGDVRWKPTPPFGSETMTRREEDEMQRELQDLFDQLPTEGEQELAYLTLREENERGAQNQTLENALARMGADRPRQFESRQFSRFNLVAAQRGAPMTKKKPRKVSAYSREFGKQLKRLKKLHPRTKIQNLMSKAHRRTRASMKKK